MGAAPSAPVFRRDWHDWIVKRDGQLAAFTRYIRENPERAWLRKRNAQYFGSGGMWIVLSPEGFHERWHPPREKECFCAEGRMLFLSLYPVLNRQPTNAELYARCHEMGDIAATALPQP